MGRCWLRNEGHMVCVYQFWFFGRKLYRTGQSCSAHARKKSFWGCVRATVARCLVIYIFYHFVAITCFFHSHFRSLLDSFLCRQDINIVDNVLRSLRSLLKLKFLGYCNASGLMHCLCREYIQSCFGKFSLLCFNSCCACLLTSGLSLALVGKSRTILRITIQKCTGKFQCTGGSTVLALHFDHLQSFSIVFW